MVAKRPKPKTPVGFNSVPLAIPLRDLSSILPRLSSQAIQMRIWTRWVPALVSLLFATILKSHVVSSSIQTIRRRRQGAPSCLHSRRKNFPKSPFLPVKRLKESPRPRYLSSSTSPTPRWPWAKRRWKRPRRQSLSITTVAGLSSLITQSSALSSLRHRALPSLLPKCSIT